MSFFFIGIYKTSVLWHLSKTDSYKIGDSASAGDNFLTVSSLAISMIVHQDSLWNWGMQQLGNELLEFLNILLKVVLR